MPKGGSGFIRGAGKAASAIQRGESKIWRLANPGDFTKEIVSLYESMYRSGIVVVSDSRGKLKEWGGSDTAMERAWEKVNELSDRIAKDVQVYNKDAAEAYSNLRSTWGKPIYVNSKDIREFRNTMKAGDSMLINPRGVRGINSDASTRAEGTGITGGNNVNILLEANKQMNATRRAIWQNASKSGTTEYYSGQIADQLWKQYEKTERGAWRRRKS